MHSFLFFVLVCLSLVHQLDSRLLHSALEVLLMLCHMSTADIPSALRVVNSSSLPTYI